VSLPMNIPINTQVLLIEDDPWVLQVNRAMLEYEPGFTVIGSAQTVREARTAVDTLEPQLILVDVYLPDGSGLEVVQHVRNARLDCEVIMITAANDTAIVQQALREGAVDYLIKPFAQSRLREALARYNARRSVNTPEQLTQHKLDRLLGFPTRQRLPKGIDETTLEQVRTYLNTSSETLSAEQVGQRIGVSRVTAWRYLEYLKEIGVADLLIDYGSVGRPVKRYVAVKTGR
jgi:response regulator of citrate/malate metabolism